MPLSLARLRPRTSETGPLPPFTSSSCSGDPQLQIRARLSQDSEVQTLQVASIDPRKGRRKDRENLLSSLVRIALALGGSGRTARYILPCPTMTLTGLDPSARQQASLLYCRSCPHTLAPRMSEQAAYENCTVAVPVSTDLVHGAQRGPTIQVIYEECATSNVLSHDRELRAPP